MSKNAFNPGGEKGKLHRELGISTTKTIPQARLNAATHSNNPEIRRDAIRAKTMEGWNHSGRKSGDHRSGVNAGGGMDGAMAAHADKMHPAGR